MHGPERGDLIESDRMNENATFCLKLNESGHGSDAAGVSENADASASENNVASVSVNDDASANDDATVTMSASRHAYHGLDHEQSSPSETLSRSGDAAESVCASGCSTGRANVRPVGPAQSSQAW